MNKICLLILLLFTTTLFGQLKINEVMSSNYNFLYDFDKDTPDWLEIYNSSDNNIEIGDFYLTDDPDEPQKWLMPNYTLQSDSTLLIFCSGKDRKYFIKGWETILREGDNWKYFVGKSQPPANWNLTEFNDASWANGPTGIGYGDSDDNTTIPSTISLYIRKVFNIADLSKIKSMLMHLDYDDGFIAYLNGIEIARAGMGSAGTPVYYYTQASQLHEAQMYNGGKPELFDINDFLSLLKNGENTLAIEVHNYGTSSSDMTIIPFLSFGYDQTPANSLGSLEILDLPVSYFHSNFNLKNSGETIMIFDKAGSVIDSIKTGEIPTDVSLGRFPNGTDNWFYYFEPTPFTKNPIGEYTGIAPQPDFSVKGGLYLAPFNLNLSIPEAGEIRFTTDGSEPDEYSNKFSSAITINSTKIIRAKSYIPGQLPSHVNTQTFIFQTNNDLPVVSLSTDPFNFFDNDSGIYVKGPNAESSFPYFGANFWQDWEKPIHIEFYESNGALAFSQDAGVKIFGNWSRGNAMKSLALFARKIYGDEYFEYELFPDREFDKYTSFLLRSSGNDWGNSMIRDALVHRLAEPLNIDNQAYRPVIVYLNGEYWGIHNLREKINDDYISAHHNVDTKDLNIIENQFLTVKGTNENYLQFFDNIENMNTATEAAWDYIKSTIDVDNFIDYYLTQIYFDNRDWPGNNLKYWQQASIDSKWRWILFDTDFCFGFLESDAYRFNTLEFALETNGPGWPNPPWSTLLLRKFLNNVHFRDLFVGRFSVYFNTIFSADNITRIINELENGISREIPRHYSRWNLNSTNWQNEINKIKNFGKYRPSNIFAHFNYEFTLGGNFYLTFEMDENQGLIQLEGIPIEQNSWEGRFFDGIPLKVQAKAKPGFTFSHWEGYSNSTNPNLTISTSENMKLKAVFESLGESNSIVINEINYNSDELNFNVNDWIELFNNSDTQRDLSGWIFKDEESLAGYVIPDGTIINPKDFLVICEDTLSFKFLFPDVKKFIGNFEFGLSGGGEPIMLFDNAGNLIDSVDYDDKAPWASEADGSGPTLELKNPVLDNNKFENWGASANHGTPAAQNSNLTAIEIPENQLPASYKLYPNYPNPFNPSTNIRYSLPEISKVKITVYNILGEQIELLSDKIEPAGFHNISWNASSFASGVYIFRVNAESISSNKTFGESIKLLLVK